MWKEKGGRNGRRASGQPYAQDTENAIEAEGLEKAASQAGLGVRHEQVEGNSMCEGTEVGTGRCPSWATWERNRQEEMPCGNVKLEPPRPKHPGTTESGEQLDPDCSGSEDQSTPSAQLSSV